MRYQDHFNRPESRSSRRGKLDRMHFTPLMKKVYNLHKDGMRNRDIAIELGVTKQRASALWKQCKVYIQWLADLRKKPEERSAESRKVTERAKKKKERLNTPTYTSKRRRNYRVNQQEACAILNDGSKGPECGYQCVSCSQPCDACYCSEEHADKRQCPRIVGATNAEARPDLVIDSI